MPVDNTGRRGGQRSHNNRGGGGRGGGQSGSSRGGGGGGRGRGRGGGGGGRGRGGNRRPRWTPYQRPTYPPHLSQSFFQTNTFSPELLRSGIQEIKFGANFEIRDEHINAIIARGPNLTNNLRSISLGDSDTGNGGYLTNNAIIDFVQVCHNLVVCSLDATTRLDDDALIAICQSNQSLEYLAITGNDKVKGSIKGPGLQFLVDNPTVVPNLKALVLLDQSDYSKPFTTAKKKLSNARKTLEIHTGETLGDGIADNMIAAMTGGVSTEVMLGGKVVSVANDFGIGEYIGGFGEYGFF